MTLSSAAMEFRDSILYFVQNVEIGLLYRLILLTTFRWRSAIFTARAQQKHFYIR